MDEFVFSDASKKLVADYLEKSANISLCGYSNSYAHDEADDAAKRALHQMLFDNPGITGVDAMRKNVYDELGGALKVAE